MGKIAERDCFVTCRHFDKPLAHSTNLCFGLVRTCFDFSVFLLIPWGVQLNSDCSVFYLLRKIYETHIRKFIRKYFKGPFPTSYMCNENNRSVICITSKIMYNKYCLQCHGWCVWGKSISSGLGTYKASLLKLLWSFISGRTQRKTCQSKPLWHQGCLEQKTNAVVLFVEDELESVLQSLFIHCEAEEGPFQNFLWYGKFVSHFCLSSVDVCSKCRFVCESAMLIGNHWAFTSVFTQ